MNALRQTVVRLVVVLALSCTALAICVAQRHSPVKIANISTQPSGSGTLVSIAADGSLNRAQTWQDSEGYHVVVPNTVAPESLKSGRGLKVRQIGTSMEVLVQTKPGAKVHVQPNGNQLNLLVDSKLDVRAEKETRAATPTPEEQQLFEDSHKTSQSNPQLPSLRYSSTADALASTSSSPTIQTAPAAGSATVPTINSPLPPQTSTQNPAEAETEITIEGEEDDGLLASVFSGTSVLVIISLGLFGLLVSRKVRSRHVVVHAAESAMSQDGEWAEDQNLDPANQRKGGKTETSTALVRSSDSNSNNGASRAVARVSGPTTLFGAYRIDQEVGKLILGQPHRIDVLSSRAIDDRRAIETSLIKGVNSSELDDNARRKAREALEEYGFVARQCASLLLASDAFERTSAARALGDIKSPAALPFLLESLYDSESIVRNQAIVSIGELKLPSAIGALLDIARTHPDVPSGLLSRTLSACSVEGLDFFDAIPAETALLGTGHDASTVHEITKLEASAPVEDLPESTDDERLEPALLALGSVDADERSEALKTLVQLRVRRSIEAIATVAQLDSEPNIRAVAISSLGIMNHESVFPTVLIAMADETREVRAAAARSLNRLSFDRADGYVRVIESCDDETIENVARACVQAGIVSQNLDRLGSCDHRQAYETFAIINLLARARMTEPVLNVIAEHTNMEVRLNAIHLIACTDQPEVFEQLRELAVKDGVGEEVKTTLLEAMYKLDQARLKKQEVTEATVVTGADFEFDLQPETENVEAEFESHVFNESESELDVEFDAGVHTELDEQGS
ncbi:MAG TPA: HEAT repeat domain-containing protein [Pyrinomonadaceae bacterium]|nr:HEAT repeat domain-containing protein [Pyrinomonadaceae bacterium]